MQALRFHGRGDVRLDEIDEPDVAPDTVKVRVHWCGICGSDLHEYVAGPILIPTPDAPHPLTGDALPLTMGHEFAGEIVAVGSDIDDLQVGDEIAVEPLIYCRECEACRSGAYNQCPDFGAIGTVGGGGAYAEFITVPRHLVHPLPANVTTEQAALAEPVVVGWHAVTRGEVERTDTALVIGAGPIGVGVLIALKARGVSTVIVSDRSTGARRDAALAFGADHVIDASTSVVGDEVRRLTDGRGADVVFEVAGVQAALDDAIDATRKGGRVVSLSVWEGPASVDLNVLLLKELSVMASVAYANEYAAVLKAISDGSIPGLERMVTGRVALRDIVEDGFRALVDRKDDHVKILVHP